jgi:hypothetical protein
VALLLALGLVLGTFPIYGCPTILCALAALSLRLNVPALQVVNRLTTPLQLALLVPFARVGAHLVGASTASGAAFNLGTAAIQAAAGWSATCVPAGIAVYFLLLHLLRRSRRQAFPLLETLA